MLTVSQLYIYPIKSLGGIGVSTAQVTDRGFVHDRRYMLVTLNNVFMSQRKHPGMALLQPHLNGKQISIENRANGETFTLPAIGAVPASEAVTVWHDTVAAQPVSEAADAWFTAALGVACKLVYMPDGSHRSTSSSSLPSAPGVLTSFADGYPFLLAGEASLQDLNNRYPGNDRLTMLRFRPNIVMAGGEAYAEDTIGNFSINGIGFTGYEKCARCAVPNVDPRTGVASQDGEPLITLRKYRKENNKIYFGVNLIHDGTGQVSVGDIIRPVR